MISVSTIGAICDRFGGEVQTGPFGSQLHASDYVTNGTPVVMPQDMADGSVSVTRIARVGAEHVKRLSQHKVQAGDVVYSRRGDVSRFAVITARESGWLCGTGSIRVRLNCPEIEIGYLRRFLQQDSVAKWLEHRAKGVTMPNLNTSIIRALPLAYPSLAEQRRIAAILDQADAIRAKRRAALLRLDRLSWAVFNNMFGNPASETTQVTSERLGDLACKFSDGPFGSNLKSLHYVEKGVRVIRLQNIGVGEFLNGNEAYISQAHFNTLRRHECRPGDILIGTMGEPNLRAVIQPGWLPVALNKADCVQMRPDLAKVTPEYVEALLNHPSTEQAAQDRIVGQTRLRISMGRLREMRVAVPPLPLQKLFSTRMLALRKLKAQQGAALEATNTLLASLQNRAFRDEL